LDFYLIQNDPFLIALGLKQEFSKRPLKRCYLSLFLFFFRPKIILKKFRKTYLLSTRKGLSIGVCIFISACEKFCKYYFGKDPPFYGETNQKFFLLDKLFSGQIL
jgi:hypothetical protein